MRFRFHHMFTGSGTLMSDNVVSLDSLDDERTYVFRECVVYCAMFTHESMYDLELSAPC